ncbi:MAG: hypothetical protein EBT45_05545 [Alphaproteobacteria bacterium]|nr:hypothetical protein [Alphaproteobacteria bacterium]
MSLKVLATSLLLISSAYASGSHHTAEHHTAGHHAAAEKPDHSKLDGKAQSDPVVKRCTAECETITEKHFMEVYGGICSADEDNLDGRRILARMEEYDEVMKKKDIKYDDEIDPKKKSKFLKYKKAEEKGSACDEPHLRKISRFDILNNSTQYKSADQEKKKLNGFLAKGEKMDPFAYGMQCVAQCRDPEGKKFGLEKAEQLYVKPGTEAPAAETSAPEASTTEAPAAEVAAPEAPATEAPAAEVAAA